ncbi:MAG: ATP-binding cassette domain-containing protein [Pseudomonadota bacterium]
MIVGSGINLALGGKPILRDVSLSLAPGQVVALCGPNGAGKSTLLSCLAGEHRDCAEAIRYFDKTVLQMVAHELANHRVVLEQNPSLSAAFTLWELIELGAPLALKPADLERLKQQTLVEFNFAGMEDRFVSELSGGQQHRVHFARVLVQLRANRQLGHECFLFLDEPTSSLDIGYQITLLRLVRALAADGVGTLVVLHDLNLASAFTDHVILLQDGMAVQSGPPKEVLTAANLSAVYATDIIVETASTGQNVIQPVL